MPNLSDGDPKRLKPIIHRWHELAFPIIGETTAEETWIDFLMAWPRVKYPAGTGPVQDLLERAKNSPPLPVAEQYEQPKLRTLVSLCYQLQQYAGDEAFFLSCRTVGRLLEIDRMTAWRWLFLLVQDEILELVSVGSQSSKKASEYRMKIR